MYTARPLATQSTLELFDRRVEAIGQISALATSVPPRTALEDPSFPFEQLSEIAELESWRKEVNRPIYHIHKWWAQRLGSVFRAILIGALSDSSTDLMTAFYAPTRLPGAVVFDPFMGSGTTLGEALKLGSRAVGRDINPVAHFAVSNALSCHSREEVMATFRAIEEDVAPRIRALYRARLDGGGEADVLYYFWVKVAACPACDRSVDLFSSYIFTRHAYPKRSPAAQAVCPRCGELNAVRYDATSSTCTACAADFDPRTGPAKGTKATCPHCRTTFPIAKSFQRGDGPPGHRLYAKLALLPDGTKRYLRAVADDLARYAEATAALADRPDAYPVAPISAGHNTDQVLNYGYRFWHEMFNDRQLLALSLLVERIRAIEDDGLRDLFACLFSGTLEFNNMFASYKGEGTGAVRHMFAHHILKPERTPLEANVWGTEKSSGAFSTLFRSRLLRALDYQAAPFEVRPTRTNGKTVGGKVFGLSAPLGRPVARGYDEFADGEALYLSCGDSARTDLPDESVDLVVTDPPFFDNVHYSELADFFYVWQRHIQGQAHDRGSQTTRSGDEVQSRDPAVFSDRLGGVFAECRRVLRRNGLLAFSYHHSRPEGWSTVLEALTEAGFVITAAQPIKAEMSRAAPKSQARHPIDLDVILVCRPAAAWRAFADSFDGSLDRAFAVAADQTARFGSRARWLSRNDVRVVVMAQLLQGVSQQIALGDTSLALDSLESIADPIIERLYAGQTASPPLPRPEGL